jgi:hypothetical protein
MLTAMIVLELMPLPIQHGSDRSATRKSCGLEQPAPRFGCAHDLVPGDSAHGFDSI